MTHEYPRTRFYLTVIAVVMIATTLGWLTLVSALAVLVICVVLGVKFGGTS